MVELLSFENIVALLTLTMLEIVLGIDNIVFLVIVTGKLDSTKQLRARRLGLFAGIGTGLEINDKLSIGGILAGAYQYQVVDNDEDKGRGAVPSQYQTI